MPQQTRHRFLIRDSFRVFLPGVAVGASCRVEVKKAALHRIREDSAQTSVQSLHGVLGERPFCIMTDDLPHISAVTRVVCLNA